MWGVCVQARCACTRTIQYGYHGTSWRRWYGKPGLDNCHPIGEDDPLAGCVESEACQLPKMRHESLTFCAGKECSATIGRRCLCDQCCGVCSCRGWGSCGNFTCFWITLLLRRQWAASRLRRGCPQRSTACRDRDCRPTGCGHREHQCWYQESHLVIHRFLRVFEHGADSVPDWHEYRGRRVSPRRLARLPRDSSRC